MSNNADICFCVFCSTKSKSKLIGVGKHHGHVRSSSRVHFAGLTPSEPSSPGDNRPASNTAMHAGLPASTDNGQLDNRRRNCDCYAEMASVNNADTLRPVGLQVMSPAAVPVLAAGGTVRRTLYSPRYTSEGRLKHYLATTTSDVLSTQ